MDEVSYPVRIEQNQKGYVCVFRMGNNKSGWGYTREDCTRKVF